MSVLSLWNKLTLVATAVSEIPSIDVQVTIPVVCGSARYIGVDDTLAEHGDQLHKMLEVMILQGVDLQAGQAYPSRPSWINYHRLATAQPMSDHMVFLKIDIRVGASTGWRMKLASFAEIGTAATRQ